MDAHSRNYLEKRLRKLRISLHKRTQKIRRWLTAHTMRSDGSIVFAKSSNAGKRVNPNGITVILNMYARAEYIHSQVEAIRAQSAPIEQLWIWYNKSEQMQYDVSALCDRFVISNHNWKFLGRFALALMAPTRYVALFDDDMLPGKQWLENCMQTIQNPTTNGILVSSGVRLPQSGSYLNGVRIGWDGQNNDQPQEVDYGGHSWFLERQVLPLMWREEPHTYDNGEDMHLSYCAQKYGGIKTFVPPHPPSDKNKWGSEPIIGRIRNCDKDASHKTTDDFDLVRNDIVATYRAKGWTIFNEQ